MHDATKLEQNKVHRYVERLISHVPELNIIRVEYPNPPDAVLRCAHGTDVAVELTQLYQGKKPRRGGDRWEHTRARAEQLQALYNGIAAGVMVDIRLKGPTLPDGTALQQLANEIADACVFYQQMEGVTEIFGEALVGSTMPHYVEELRVLPRSGDEVERLRRWHDLQILDLEETFRWIPSDEMWNGLVDAVESKMSKLPTYRAHAKEVWLLMHGGRSPSSWPPDAQQLREIAATLSELFRGSGFDRIVYDPAYSPPIVLWP